MDGLGRIVDLRVHIEKEWIWRQGKAGFIVSDGWGKLCFARINDSAFTYYTPSSVLRTYM